MKQKEILVGVGILVILGLVLAMVFSAQKQQGREALALRTLQQWGIALNLYLIDHNHTLPSVGSIPVPEAPPQSWFNALPPYLSRAPLSTLPPGERPRPGQASFWVSPASPPQRVWDENEFYFGYAMNAALQPDPDLRAFKISELEVPAKVIFMGETSGFSPALDPGNIRTFWGPGSPGSPRSTANILFADGHVESVSRSTLDAPETRSIESLKNDDISWFLE
jgi:prepilin-type processing-associated H-X9-DG protein